MQETFDSTGYKLEDRGARWIEGYAFLKPGVTRQQAEAELNAISQRLENDYPETNRGHDLSNSCRCGKRRSTAGTHDVDARDYDGGRVSCVCSSRART